MKQAYFKFLFIVSLFFVTDGNASPLLFIENKGQITDQYRQVRTDIDLSIPGNGMTLFVGDGQLHYQFAKSEMKADSSYDIKMYRLDVELIGADKGALLLKEEPQYFTERYYTDLFSEEGGVVRSYTRAVYKNVYPGIDWVLYVRDNKLKHEFVVNKGANPRSIKLKYSGALLMDIGADGGLRVVTPMGNVTEATPYSYDSKGRNVSSSFKLKGNELSFNVGAYEGTLTIDPAIGWSTYYGTVAGSDVGMGVAHDLAGNLYIAGHTSATSNMATTGSHQFNMGGGWNDGFMVKFNQLGERIWATYYGGTGEDAINCMTIDNDNNIYVGGSSESLSAIATPGTHKPTTTNGDAFVAKFDTSGQRLWGTYFGGPTNESIVKIECDNSGAVYVTGNTNSTSQISTPGTHQQTFAGGFHDAFLAKFTANGQLTWGTYLGGPGNEWPKGLCIDGTGNIYIGGETDSETGISTPGSHQEVRGLNAGDVYFVKFDPSGNRIWGTYYGGDHNVSEYGGLCAFNGNGALYLAGGTRSYENIATLDGLQPTISLPYEQDAFAAKFDENGTRIWGTYYGGLGSETISAIACDNDGNLFMGGSGFSLDLGGPCSPQTENAGNGDIFVIKITSLCEPVWDTYQGGPGGDVINDLDYDGNGNLYMTGGTFNHTVFGSPNVYQPTYGGAGDAYLLKYVDCATPGQPIGITGPTPVCEGDTVIYYVGALCNATAYTWVLPQGWGGFSTVDSIICLVGQSGTISAYATTGCGTSSPQSMFVDVFPAPEPPIYQNGNLLTTDNIYTSYQWGFNGADVPGATLPYHTMSVGTGFYTLTVTDTNGCTGFTNYLPTSVKNEELQHVKVYPNPATNIVHVEGLNDGVDYEICDVVGAALLKGTLQNKNNTINIAELPKGVYLLKIGNRSMKLTKQ